MSGENVDRLRGLYARMARGDFRGPTDLFAPEFVYEPMSDGREAFVGMQAFADQMRDFLAQWDDFTIEAQEFEDLGDAVLVTEVQRGTGKRSGVTTEKTFFAIWTFRDGLIVRARWDDDRETAMRAAGRG